MQKHKNFSILSCIRGVLYRTNNIQMNKKKYFSTMKIEQSSLISIFILALIFGLIQNSAAVPSLLTEKITYSSAWTLESPVLSLDENRVTKQYYYEPIQITVPLAGAYTFMSKSSINTDGRIYYDEFHPENSSLNKLVDYIPMHDNNQFIINIELEADHKYILVVMTNYSQIVDQFSIMSIGPNKVHFEAKKVLARNLVGRTTMTTILYFPSTYEINLSAGSPSFVRPQSLTTDDYYYAAFEMTIYSMNVYTFTSISSIDTFGCLYSGSFKPGVPSQNLMACDDDSGGDYQFRMNVNLQYGQTYILVVTTYDARYSGNVLVSAESSEMMSRTSDTTSTTRPRTSTTSLATSLYSGSLSVYSLAFSRPGKTERYYYQAVQFQPARTGIYSFASSSSWDTYGLLYSFPFNPLYPSSNLIQQDDDSNGNDQFRIIANLEYSRTYVLVFTTYSAQVTGSFSILTSGPSSINMFSYDSTTVATLSSTISPTYYGSLSSISPVFIPPSLTSGYRYYQVIRISVYTTGRYRFESASSIDTYGMFYYNNIDPSYPSTNLIKEDDDGNGNQQFRIVVDLQYGSTYYLLVTTYRSMETGTFRINAFGPGSIGWTSYTASTSRPIQITTTEYYNSCALYGTCGHGNKDTGTAVGITIGCLALVIIIAAYVTYRHKKKRASTASTATTSRIRSQNNQQQASRPGYAARNAREITSPIPMYRDGIPNVEEPPPPSYEMAILDLMAKERREATNF
ncbi:hypothetical protein I4U23_012226 [Adineta vaga]|nr:hypothetical protein I4U23_012226 [Adineta vaga]